VALRNGSSQDIILYRHTDGTLGISNGVSGLTYSSSTQLTLGAWHEVELTATLNASTGTVNAYLDGVAVTGLSQTSLNTGGTLASGYIGTTTSGRAWTAYFDEVAIDRVRPGDAASLYVADSLHVSGTAGVAGTFVVQQPSGTRLLAAYAPGNFVEVGSRTAAASPAYLWVSDWSSAAGGAPTLMGNWASSNSWGVGANSNASDNTLRFGVTNGAGTAAWSSTQNLNAHFAGTLKVQPTTGNDSTTALSVQTAGGVSVFAVDTSGSQIFVGGPIDTIGATTVIQLGGTNATDIWLQKNTRLSGNLVPEAAGTRDLGSTTAEFDDIYVGNDDGIFLGADQDAVLAYDEAGDDRIELSGSNASLYLEDRLGLGKQALTTAAGGVGTQIVSPADSYLGITVSEDGDTIQIDEALAKDGDLLFIVNEDTTASDTVIIEDLDNQIELTGDANASLDQGDTLLLIYNGTLTAWTQVGGSNN
jgi:hypothetical protein